MHLAYESGAENWGLSHLGWLCPSWATSDLFSMSFGAKSEALVFAFRIVESLLDISITKFLFVTKV